MSKFQSEKSFPNSQNTPTTPFELGLGFLNPSMGGGADSRVLYDLCALLLTLLRTPTGSAPPPSQRREVTGPRAIPSMTPAEMATMMFGASMVLVLCGSVTFVIGMMMMPWVIGLVIFCYFMGIVSSLKSLGRMLLCSGSSLGSTTSSEEVNGSIYDVGDDDYNYKTNLLQNTNYQRRNKSNRKKDYDHVPNHQKAPEGSN